MSFTSGFFNATNRDRAYNAEQVGQLFDGIIKDGIYMSIGQKMMVTPSSGMTVQVGTGRAWFRNTWSYNDSPYAITLSASDLLLDRIDTIVLEVNKTDAVRTNSLKFVKGTPSASPVAPTLIKNNDILQVPLANVRVKTGTSKVDAADIENKVGTSSCPFVTGVIQNMNIDSLIAQWNAQWTNWTNGEKAAYVAMINEMNAEWDSWTASEKTEFNVWFNGIKGQLSTDAAGNLQNQINDINGYISVTITDPSNWILENGYYKATTASIAGISYSEKKSYWFFSRLYLDDSDNSNSNKIIRYLTGDLLFNGTINSDNSITFFASTKPSSGVAGYLIPIPKSLTSHTSVANKVLFPFFRRQYPPQHLDITIGTSSYDYNWNLDLDGNQVTGLMTMDVKVVKRYNNGPSIEKLTFGPLYLNTPDKIIDINNMSIYAHNRKELSKILYAQTISSDTVRLYAYKDIPEFIGEVTLGCDESAKGPIGTVYGFHINSSEPDPYAAVTYLADASKMTPAHMDFSTGVFDWGSWKDAFFMPRPCMLKSNGRVGYYLNPNDYTKKVNGSSSDIANDAYDGNAMMEWGKDGKLIWYKIVPDAGDSTSASVYIADYQVDSGYHAWSFINNQGVLVDHFYTPIYNGSIDSNGKLRSISGKSYANLCTKRTVAQEIIAAELNNTGSDKLWYTEVYADIMLIDLLLILMGKSLDSQAVYGNGRSNQNTDEQYALNTGTMDKKGLFWGGSSINAGVKVFGMENWWGNLFRRYAGHVTENSNWKYKMTRGRQDGSTASDYNTTGNGYLFGGSVPSIGFATKMQFNEKGFMPKESDPGDDRFWRDYFWRDTSSAYGYLLRGGRYNDPTGVNGAFYFNVRNSSASGKDSGASLSCKPPAYL